jgi:hypothetical protein
MYLLTNVRSTRLSNNDIATATICVCCAAGNSGPLKQEILMPSTYEVSGALPVLDNFRHGHAQQFAESLTAPADVYFATDAVTHSLVIRIRGALSDDELESVEEALDQFSQKWARAGAIFSRVRYGEPSFVPLGLVKHVELLEELADERLQMDACLRRQARILEKFRKPDTATGTSEFGEC